LLPQQKILRVLTLLRLLRDPFPKTVKQLSQLLECDERTLYRYRDLLSELGYTIELNERNGWHLPAVKERHAADLTTEEVHLLRTALSSLPVSHPLKQSIQRKLFLKSELLPLSDELAEVRRARTISLLQEAIRHHRVVKLCNYLSVNSDRISDRIVEPLEFDADFSQLTAWEPSLGGIRHFKTARIPDVELLPEVGTYQGHTPPTDLFGMDGEPFTIKLQLSRRAHSLLVEEHPAARPYLQPSKDKRFPYRLVAEVRSPAAIGRFVLGLPGEVLVLEPASLLQYLRDKAAAGMWLK
jgi:predicted DNA-binding transcriptional regulator YafY